MQNDDIEKRADIPVLFAEITALLEDAHEIAARGQNSRLAQADYLEAANQITQSLDQMRSLIDSIKIALPPAP